jgi:hypothetical protein
VIGVIAIIAAQTLRSSVEGTENRENIDATRAAEILAKSAPSAVLYILALAVLYRSTSKYTPILLVVVGALAGQFLFV